MDKSKSLMHNLETWEQQVRDYEKRFLKVVDVDLRVGILLELSPDNVREHVHVNSDRYDTYESVRDRLASYLDAKSTDADDAAAPMDVDTLTKRLNALEKGHGKGKGKGKNNQKGKFGGKGSKGNGKDSKGKKGKGGSGKNSDVGKGKATQPAASGKGSASDKINGYCSICWGWGHPARACWHGQSSNALTANGAQPDGQDQAGGAAQPPVETQNCLIRDNADDNWMLVFLHTGEQELLTVLRGPAAPERVRVLVDTCSAGSVAPPSIGQQFELTHRNLRPYRSATGDLVGVKGTREFVMNAGGPIVKHTFEVADKETSPPGCLILSAGTIISNGNRIILDDVDGSYIINKKTNRSIPLYKKNNIYEFEVELCEVGIRHKEILVNEAAASSSSMGQSGPARPEDAQLVAARPDEARTAKSLTLPKAPTNVAEVKAHSVTHMPHRDWCAHCVRGRGRAARHFNESDAAELPRLSTDYLFPGQKEDKRPLTGISFYDNASLRMALTILPRKGVDHPYAAAWLKKQLDMGGYTRALVKNDQEPTLKALRRLALSQEPKSATAFTLEESMAGDSQTNGEIEAVNGVLEGLLRTHKSQLDANFGFKVPSDHPIMSWLAPFVGILHCTHSVGPDGRTPYERLHGHKFNRALAHIGESIHYKPLKKEAKLLKLEPNWALGMFLGILESSGEYIVSNDDGISLKCRDVKRMVDDLRFDKELLGRLKSTPWQPNPTGEDIEPAALAHDLGMQEPRVPGENVQPEPPLYRKFYVTKALIDKYGKTTGCPGCSQRGVHNDACRNRVIEKLRSDPISKERYEQRDTVEGQFERAFGVPAVPPADAGNGAEAGDAAPRQEQSGQDASASNPKPPEPADAPAAVGAEAEPARVQKRSLEDPPSREELFPEPPAPTRPEKRPIAELDESEEMLLNAVTCEEPLYDDEIMAQIEVGDNDCWDEEAGVPLDPEAVKNSMAAELQECKKFELYEECEENLCYEVTGKAPISCRWRVINKGDLAKPDIRARLLAREIRRKGWDAVFAATPPLWAFRYLLSELATNDPSSNRSKKLMIIDLKRAFFHSESSGKTFVKPPHLRGTTRCWRLLKSMYGTLHAASEFQDTFNFTLVEKIALNQGQAQICLYYCPRTGMKLVYHGDDIGAVSYGPELDEFHKRLSKSFEANVKYLIGPEAGDDKSELLLNRCITYTDAGVLWEADPRHAELVICELGLQGARGRTTPGSRNGDSENESCALLGPEQTKAYRSTAARVGFLAEDRWDLRFASKECLRAMQAPTLQDLQKLKHLGRYLISYPRLAQLFAWQSPVTFLDSIGDTDHAGCRTTRKSTNGGVIMKGKHGLHSWSTTQSLPSLSSGESEWYGLTKTCAEGLGVQSGAADLGDTLGLRGWSDATAALGISKRQGAGKLKHVESRFLWVQDAVKKGRLTLHKEETKLNKGDCFTKYLGNPELMKHVKAMGFVILEGRHSLAPHVAADLGQMNRTSPLLMAIALALLVGADAQETLALKPNSHFAITATLPMTELHLGLATALGFALAILLLLTHYLAYLIGENLGSRRAKAPVQMASSSPAPPAPVVASTTRANRTAYELDGSAMIFITAHGKCAHLKNHCSSLEGKGLRCYSLCLLCGPPKEATRHE